MGGTVSLLVAIQFPKRVSKVVVIGSPIDGSSLAMLLKLSGYRSIAMMVFNTLWALGLGLKLSGPFISSDPKFYEMMDRDLSKTTLESFLLSIASLRKTDLRPLLHKIKVPTLGMYGNKDIGVHPDQCRLASQIATSNGMKMPVISLCWTNPRISFLLFNISLIKENYPKFRSLNKNQKF